MIYRQSYLIRQQNEMHQYIYQSKAEMAALYQEQKNIQEKLEKEKARETAMMSEMEAMAQSLKARMK